MKKITAVLCLCLAGLPAVATEKMYGIAGGSFTDLEYSQQGEKGAGFTLAVGHQFHPQWYVEAGYNQLIDETTDTGDLKGDALYLALLGKAGNHTGELFYKLGIMNVAMQGSELPVEGNCALGELSSDGACAFDESGLAGVVGLGFDYHLGLRSMLRVEYNYVGGENDLQAHTVNLAIRYNFN
ncbi:porin family protein [Alteromonas sp. ASW11-19]|uniref:Porin family protein n=1 Tax=Alteromonas salexigens TaxID=2982530 RepID=A0ABT2VRS3_9ALTE|nr:porin family protein [Alteromonas salexigens]MCU7555602.1 porin family protein [Alteromonas salexigens]